MTVRAIEKGPGAVVKRVERRWLWRFVTVCHTHGGRAPQVKAAAALRLAMGADLAVRQLVKIVGDKKHPRQFAAIKEVLERNDLYPFGVERPQTGNRLTVNTQVNTRDINVASLSDTDLVTYENLLRELKELLPSEEPKALPGVECR